MSADALPDLMGRIVDGFRFENLLGRGGMGEVWKAWDTRLDRQVAVKILSAKDVVNEDAVRFEREAKAVSGISHPNIAHVYATGSMGGRPYYVMEYIEGRSLGKLLEQEGRLDPLQCLDYLEQAAEGLAGARARGVIHRDVKPDNLMVDYDGRLKVVDFGLARRVQGDDASITQTNMVVGTPKYMAPEQATGGTVDHRSDIYALGATFYHLLTGSAPFEAPTPVAVMMKHVHERPTPIRVRAPQVPVAVSAIVDRMMAKQPEYRFQTYEELLAEVKRALAPPAPRAATPTVSLPSAARPAAMEPAKSGPPLLILGAMAGAVGILVFLAFRAGREIKVPLSADPAPSSITSPVVAPPGSGPLPGMPGGGVQRPHPSVGEPSEPAPSGEVRPPAGMPDSPLFFGAISMANHAKTMAAMRKLSTALHVYTAQNEEGGLPHSLEELTREQDMFGIHPRELVDGWGTRIQYDRVSPHQFRLASAGPDRGFGTDDDIVIENGTVIKGDVDERAYEKFMPPQRPRRRE